MQIEWIKGSDKRRLLLFFNGWGMEAQAVAHLQGEADVTILSDYRTLALPSDEVEKWKAYREVDAMAWSMGVWAAANVLPQWKLPLRRTMAINGTERPVDDVDGIPCKVYGLTERGMDERGRQRFFARMLDNQEELERFLAYPSRRSLQDVREELTCIREQSTVARQTFQWEKAIVSTADVIFPVANQLHWWRGRAKRIVELPGGHYPFYRFQNWEELWAL